MGNLTLAHWIYIIVILAVVIAMFLRRDVVAICIIGIFLIGLESTGSVVKGIQTVFTALLTAGKEFFLIMLVIALMISMLNSLKPMGADALMVSPAKKLMKNPTVAFFLLGAIIYIASLFFWATPAIVLFGPILAPVAIGTGLPALGVAQVMNIMANGMALSGDIILQGAPTISAKASGAEVISLITKGGVLSIVAGLTAIIAAYLIIRKDIALADGNKILVAETAGSVEHIKRSSAAMFFAIAVPAVFSIIIILMLLKNIKGGDSTALLGGTALLILLAATIAQHKDKAPEKITEHIKEGLLFSVKIFAPVIPIVGFFFLGGNEVSLILGEKAPKLLFDIGHTMAAAIPINKFALCFGNLIIGLITGLDGSGFSGLPLTGGLAGALGTPAGIDVSAVAAVGQLGSVWSGGGTIVAWAFGLVVVAGIAQVSPLDLARKNFIPVFVGLVSATLFAIFFM